MVHVFRVALLAFALLSCSCVGGRLGVRSGYTADTKVHTGVYGGPTVRLGYGANIPGVEYSFVAVELAPMFASEDFQTITPMIQTFQVDRNTVWSPALALGVEFGGGKVSVHGAACTGLVVLIVEASWCVRWSSRGWYGTDVNAGFSGVVLTSLDPDDF